jgi:hypothetical protein
VSSNKKPSLGDGLGLILNILIFLIKNYKTGEPLDCDDIGATPKISFVKLIRFG